MSPERKYPFDKLAFVDVPVSFYAFERSWKEKNDYVHPEMQFTGNGGVLSLLNFDEG